MQFNQPFYGNQFCNTQYVPPVPGSQYSFTNPEIIGEGEVTSLMYPDGSIQFFFLPRIFGNGSYLCRNNSAWFIRSVSSPHFSQQLQNLFNIPCAPPPSAPKVELPIADYQLKFHNDGCSSTTDLHYFLPRLRQCEWIPKLGAAVQVELPTTPTNIYHYQVLCDKPCNCQPKPCCETKACQSDMYIEEAKESKQSKVECECSTSQEQNKHCKCTSDCKISKRQSKKSFRKKKNKKHRVDCSCKVPSRTNSSSEMERSACKSVGNSIRSILSNRGTKPKPSDKKVTTYTDQSSSYVCDECCETSLQSSNVNSGGRESDTWYDQHSERLMLVGGESGSSLGSSSVCESCAGKTK